MTTQPTLTFATVWRWLNDAPLADKSAVLAEASQALGSLQAVYALLERDRSKGVP